MKTKKDEKPSGMVKLHMIKLIVRSLLFVALLTVYLTDKSFIQDNIYGLGNTGVYLLGIIWLFFVVEMVLRFFPSKYETTGSGKQFVVDFVQNKNSIPDSGEKIRDNRSVIIIGVLWIALCGGIAALFLTGVIDESIVLLISLFFSVCDIVCILFYCPFQHLIMKNRCCTTCHIYNWDFLMMFLPLVVIGSWYTISLFALALLIFLRWEWTYYRHPERFYEETNKKLLCSSCTEQLCRYKKPSYLSGRIKR